MREKNVPLVAKVSPEMKRQIFAIADKKNEAAAAVMRDMLRKSLEEAY